jgi:predicted RNA binding protein YcfA (HicA-like mRNA interferase family)
LKTPRNLSGAELVKALRKFGYERVRQDGSHVRLTTQQGGEYHLTVPHHSPLKVGTLNALLKLVAIHHHLNVNELLEKLGV